MNAERSILMGGCDLEREREGAGRLALWGHYFYVLTSIVQKRPFSAVLVLLAASVSSAELGSGSSRAQVQGTGQRGAHGRLAGSSSRVQY